MTGLQVSGRRQDRRRVASGCRLRLSGRLADDAMRRLARTGDGMFPGPREVTLRCSCPDGAQLCKHLAAVFYAIGNRLDTRPELLFLLRGVDQTELVAAATKESVSRAVRSLVGKHIPASMGFSADIPRDLDWLLDRPAAWGLFAPPRV